jgi:hypothetical protein
MDMKEAASVMKQILGLTYEPIAVKFLTEKTPLAGFEMPSERRYCQVLMGAREGEKLLLTADNISALPLPGRWASRSRQPSCHRAKCLPAWVSLAVLKLLKIPLIACPAWRWGNTIWLPVVP